MNGKKSKNTIKWKTSKGTVSRYRGVQSVPYGMDYYQNRMTVQKGAGMALSRMKNRMENKKVHKRPETSSEKMSRLKVKAVKAKSFVEQRGKSVGKKLSGTNISNPIPHDRYTEVRNRAPVQKRVGLPRGVSPEDKKAAVSLFKKGARATPVGAFLTTLFKSRPAY